MAFFDTGPPQVRAVQAALLGTFPEVATPQPPYEEAGGIWEESEVQHVAFESLSFPRVHIQWLVAQPWPESPMTAVAMEQPVIAYYLTTTTGGATEDYRSKLQTLKRALLDRGLIDPRSGAAFQLLPHRFAEHLTANPWEPYSINTIMIVRNQYAMGAGLGFSFLVGDDGR